MKMRKVISAFLVLICIISTLGLCTIGASAAEGAKTVYATTSTSIKQGSYEYLYVYLDDLTDLSALNISVYYDSEDVTVKSVYNQVPSVVNDLAMGDGQVNASYIFDGKGSAEKTNLFYIYYQVNSTAEVGETYFDIVVNEAFDLALESMDFTGSRCAFEIAEQTVSKSCTISSTSNASTSVGEEFELSYHLSTYQIASGSMNIQYDPELFEIVTVVNGGFLEGKITDVNTTLDGTVSISFVGTTYQFKYDVVTVRFKTLKNVTETSDIKLVVTDLYDKELNLYSCSGYTTKASITFDESYTEDAPSMSISSSYNAETGKVTTIIKLEKDSMLGAGDFALKFDTRYLTYISAEKGFSPTFFNINDKDAADGILKFSIISLSDITDEQVILTVVFEAKHYCQDKIADFEISGSGLTNSLVNTIPLNFVDSSIIIPLKHTAATAVVENRVEPTCTVNGSYDSVVYCSVCSIELSREAKTIDKLGHDYSTEWTEDVAPTCATAGSKSHHCTRCDDKANVTEISPNGHSAGSIVLENNVAPDCTNKGSYDNVVYCTVCGDELSRENITVDELGHTEVIDEAVTATCTATGLTEGKHCSVCNEVLVAQEVVEKLGHDYTGVVTAPTCTEKGYTTYTCTRCSDSYVSDYVDELGHTEVIDEAVTATCTATGLTEGKHCSVCNEVLVAQEVVEKLGHTEGAAIVENRVEPTCMIDGSYDSVISCSVCDTELSRVSKTIEKLGHEYEAEWTIDAESTCVTDGSKSHHCVRCEEKADITAIPANGHSYSEWYEIQAPTCTVTGTDEHKCSDCQATETRTIAALGHTEAEAVVENRVEPTCTENGNYDSVIYCSVCNDELSRETKIIDKLGHDYSTERKYDETSHWNECACGEKTTIEPHSWNDGVITKESTIDEEGKRTYECVVCGATKDESIARLAEKELSDGAIAGIAVGSTVVVGTGGFSLFWFVIKKKRFADLLKIFKKV